MGRKKNIIYKQLEQPGDPCERSASLRLGKCAEKTLPLAIILEDIV